MVRTRSRPRAAFPRVQSNSTRNVIFSSYRSLIEKAYVVEGRPLKEIMEYMQKNYGILQSPKQYKSQLKAWGFRHKLTLRDAAFILRLLNQARAQGLDEVVLFSKHPRRREDIKKYLHRNVKVSTETALLSHISAEEPTPDYIQLQSVSPEQHQQTPSQLPPTPPSGSSSGSLEPPPGCVEVPPMRVPIPSPELSPRASSDWSGESNNAVPSSVSNQGAHPGVMEVDLSQYHAPDVTAGSQSVMPRILEPFFPSEEEFDQLAEGQQWDDDDHGMLMATDLTNATLSVTPAVVAQLGDLGFDIHRFGDHTHSRQLNDGSNSAQFVTNCLFWLICVGQVDAHFQERALYHLNTALIFFYCMLEKEHAQGEECLGALSIVAALFDCYGQWQRLSELLVKCDEMTRNHLDGDNPFTRTIAFKKNMLQNTGGRCPPHDIAQLRYIYVQMQQRFSSASGPALVARYNLAWAMLENELKKPRAMRDCEPARSELYSLLAESEAHFGESRIETIMAAATLARATFNCGNVEEAENIIVNVVFPRVRRNFPENHPYTWEAKHRHAYFLFQLAKKENGARSRSHLQLGEQLLREVVRDRHRILGGSNPKSVQSFRLLRDILMEQGRDTEANSLWDWCKRELSQYGYTGPH